MRVDSLPAEPQGEPKNTGVGSLSLLQGIFPTQESNQALLRCRQILYQLSYQGSPRQTSLRLQGYIFRLNKSRGGFSVCVCVCVCVCVSGSVTSTLCDPVDCSPPGSSVRGILQARTLELFAIPFSRGLPDPGSEHPSLCLLQRQMDSLPRHHCGRSPASAPCV